MGRKRAIKFKRGYLASPLLSLESPSKSGLLHGLNCLSSLWEKGFAPKDLRRHYFLTWLAYSNGVLHKQARLLRMHRNSLIVIFGRMGLGTRTYKFRRLWLKLAKKGSKKPFNSVFLSYCRVIAKNPAVSPAENKALVYLWLSKFPLRALSAHYVLWAFRKGMTRREAAGKLGITKRTLHRLVIYGTTRSKGCIWLSLLKPKIGEWYPGWAPQRK